MKYAVICLFLGGLLRLDRNICRRWERKTKTRKVIRWRYPQSLYPSNVVPALSPQLFRHNEPMGATALDWEGFSPEQICHQTGQEWRAYPGSKTRKWKASFNEHLLYAKHFPMSALIVLSSELYSKKNGFLASWVGWDHLICYPKWFMLPKGVEAVSQGAGKDRPRARSLLQP